MTGRFGLDLAVGVLAGVGLWVTVDKTAAGILRVWEAGILRVWEWARRDRVAPLLEDACPDCGGTDWHEWDCPVDPALDPLPPERTREELGFTEEQRAHWSSGRCWCDEFHRDHVETIALVPRPPGILTHLDVARERRAPWWEAEHRAAYESLGFDYPSGLMARVRELTP